MHWLQNAHVRRYHKCHRTSGHLWQGRRRFRSSTHDEHSLTVLRYVERNALRAKLVRKAENWRWSSASQWHQAAAERPSWLTVGPVPRPHPWLDFVNTASTPGELESTLRPRGRPANRTAEWVE